MIECVGCGGGFDPIACRWLCPRCGTKNSCCEGAPLAMRESAIMAEHVDSPADYEFSREGLPYDAF